MQNKVDFYSGYEDKDASYPYLLIEHSSSMIGVLLNNLPEGDVPIALKDGEEEIELAITLERSINCLGTLANITKFKIMLSKNKYININNINDLIESEECSLWMQ